MSEVAARLRRRFPELPEDTIRSTVDETRRGFEQSKIRDYVPVLVEREARDTLRHVTRGSSATG